MDDDQLRALLSRALDAEDASTHSTLDAVDVEQHLRDLYRRLGLPPGLAEQTPSVDGALPRAITADPAFSIYPAAGDGFAGPQQR
jgi:hypothetical protein